MMRRSLTLVAAAGISLATVITGSPASGAPAADPIAEGVKLRKAGRDQEALQLFQQAVEQQPTPRGIAQLGLCEHALGLWVDAEKHLEQALRDARDPWIAKNEKTLRADLAGVQSKLGSIEVWGTPAGATVSLDGHPAGTLPLAAPIRAVEGRRTLAVEAPGYHPQSLTIDVSAGTPAREHVALAPLAIGAAGPATMPASGQARPEALLSTSASSETAGTTERTPIYKRWWFWSAVAGVVVAGGVTAFLVSRSGGGGCPTAPGAQCFTW
jgi:hypothetical protein